MYAENNILVGANENTEVYLLSKLANRHGLIAGATGTGKTVTLKTLAEAFSDMGVPVFLADMKGDVSGLAKVGEPNAKVTERMEKYSLADKGFVFKSYPVEFWDLYGEKGLPIRVTISEMGPQLLSKILNLSEAQEGVLNIVFRVADDENLLLIDLKDLKSMINHVSDNAELYESQYGAVAKKSATTLLRSILTLEDQGGDLFFGEPALELSDFMQCNDEGKGMINVLDSVKLSTAPELYSTFLLWMISELYETMPEVGDLDKPKFVFFFDEAHLLFDDMSPAFQKKVEQIIRLIRSKGIGVYFITQSPSDIPDTVLSQLGNRVQHALHAYTPKEQKAVKTAAETFRPNPEFDTTEVISTLGTGEALVSVLEEKGAPSIVQQVDILPPQSFIGAIEDNYRAELMSISSLRDKYRNAVDRESAYEMLLNKIDNNPNVQSEIPQDAPIREIPNQAEQAPAQQAPAQQAPAEQQAPAQQAPEQPKQKGLLEDVIGIAVGTAVDQMTKQTTKSKRKTTRKTTVEKATTTVVNTAAREVTKGIIRGLFGNMK
ncbi:helicase HerA-like domain-containing protein [uncultured Methanobrevibacter sp.]|uniref:helicase HerA-like domain-containing protein n=1 Tax=uncultured Methanobrevibacter sp. TaxID=253161 RepID=UPI00261C36B6|nr:helicase HerA-like domain-containing protein [uncultured Methanobrevibacter sp.]